MPYYDLRDNLPELYYQFKSYYYEGLESYKQPQTVMWARKSSRSSVKRTAKHQYSLKQQHKLEGQLQAELRAEFGYLKSNALMRLDFKGNRAYGYIAETNFGHVIVVPVGDVKRRFVAFATNAADDIFVWHESRISYKDALAQLFKKPWGVHLKTERTYSAYQLYRGVYFHFKDSADKPPRNTARVWKMNSEIVPLWGVHTAIVIPEENPAQF